MFERNRDRVDKDTSRNNDLDLFKNDPKDKDRDRSSNGPSLYNEIMSMNAAKDTTYNLVKMTTYDMLRFIKTKKIKTINKLASGKLDKEKMQNMELNANDYIYYQIAQMNKGVLTEKNLNRYAKETFYSKRDRAQFVNLAKLRLHSLRSAGCVNDISRSKYKKHKVDLGDRKIDFYAREKIVVQVTHNYKDKLIDLKDAAAGYRLSNHDLVVLDAIKTYDTRQEIIDHVASYYSYDLEAREGLIGAKLWKLEKFGYIEKYEGVYYANLDIDFNSNIDYINQKILCLARDSKITQESLEKLYEKANIDEDALPFIADSRLGELKYSGLIGEDNKLTEYGKSVLDEQLEILMKKVENQGSLVILDLCIKGFSKDEYKSLLSQMYDEAKVEKKLNGADYTLENLTMLKLIDKDFKITGDGLKFLERSRIVTNDDSKIIKYKEPGYFQKQILKTIRDGNFDFSHIKIGELDFDMIDNICRVNAMKLYSEGYLTLDDGLLVLSEQGLNLLYKDNYKVTYYDTKNILEPSKEGIFTREAYEKYQLSQGKSIEEINKSFEAIEERLKTHMYNELIIKKGNDYILTEDFILACGKNPKRATKEFNLTDYDKNILKLIDKKSFSKEGVLKELKDIYGADAERRYYIMRSRAKTLAKEGYVYINDKKFYSLTDEGRAILDDYKYKLSYFDYKAFLQPSIGNAFTKDYFVAYYTSRGFDMADIKKDMTRLNSRLELHVNSGLIEHVDGKLYMIKSEFWDKYKNDYIANKEYKPTKFDTFIFRRAENRIIDVEKYVNELHEDMNLKPASAFNKEKMFTNRLLLLEKEGFVTKIDDYRYMLTNKEHIRKDKTDGKVLRLGRFDKAMYNKLKTKGLAEGFTLEDLSKLGNEKDARIFTGRCVKLQNSGYIRSINGSMHFTKDFMDFLNNRRRTASKPNEVKINRFDVNKIYRVSHNNKLNKDIFKQNYKGTDLEIEKMYKRVEGRLESLVAQGYISPVDDGYLLNPKFLNECREHEKKLVRMKDKDRLDLSNEQRFILGELKSFFNITEKQFNSIDNYSSELTSLYNRGVIDYEYRLISNERTKVYYLTKEGKSLVSKITGVKTGKVFSSKIHSRPEELEHDVLIYSAYQDAKLKLENNDKHIIGIKTDRDMRSEDMSNTGKMREEYSDLLIEYTDKSTGEYGYINLEVDLHYSASVIASKAQNIDNLVWYTNSTKQHDKIKSVDRNAKVIIL